MPHETGILATRWPPFCRYLRVVVSPLAGRPPGHRFRGQIRLRGNLHQKGLTGRRYFDSAFLEAPLHATVELALDRPAAAVGASNLADDRHHRAVHLVDPPQFEVAADRRPEFGLTAHFSDDFLEYLAGAVGILLVVNVNADGRVTRAAAGIGDRRHRAEGNDMQRAVPRPQPDRAN